jgi:nucleoside-diphosphate-sugar epimerase
MPDKVFVTGGTGHLGHSLLPMLQEAGFSARVLTRRPEQHPWLKDLDVEIVCGDVADSALLTEAVAGCRYVIHAAGLFSFWGQPEHFTRVNHQGSLNVMNAAHKAAVEKFVHISTVVVVGNHRTGGPIDENHPIHPVDAYQISKYAGEQSALQFHQDHNLPVVVLRPGAFYGPHSHYAFNRLFIEEPLRGLRLQVFNGRKITFPVYVADVAQGILLALQRGVAGKIYHICGDPLSQREAAAIISEEAGISRFRLNVPAWGMTGLAKAWEMLSTITRTEPFYPLNLKYYIFEDWPISSQKARHELGFSPIDFRQGIRQTLAWYQQIGFYRGRKNP